MLHHTIKEYLSIHTSLNQKVEKHPSEMLKIFFFFARFWFFERNSWNFLKEEIKTKQQSVGLVSWLMNGTRNLSKKLQIDQCFLKEKKKNINVIEIEDLLTYPNKDINYNRNQNPQANGFTM